MGARHLRRWLHRPISDRSAIESRLDAVEALKAEYRYEPLRAVLKDVADLERILSRVALGSARPRDSVDWVTASRFSHSFAVGYRTIRHCSSNEQWIYRITERHRFVGARDHR